MAQPMVTAVTFLVAWNVYIVLVLVTQLYSPLLVVAEQDMDFAAAPVVLIAEPNAKVPPAAVAVLVIAAVSVKSCPDVLEVICKAPVASQTVTREAKKLFESIKSAMLVAVEF